MLNMTIEDCIETHLEYLDGKLFWKNRWGVQSHLNGKEAGGYDKDGYRRLRLNGHLMFTHRVIYFMHHGVWPEQIDHINRIKDDNRIENLRGCTSSQNRMNVINKKNESVYGKNIDKRKRDGRYRVRLNVSGKQMHVGDFEDLELAQLVASEARKKYYGEWAYDY